MGSVRKALFYAAGSQYVIKTLNFISVIVLARLLTPEELGIFAIASSVVMLISEIRMLGTTNYLIRQQTIDADMIKSGVGLTLIVCWLLGLLIFLFAPSIASFYELPPLEQIFQILSFAFLFAPFISVTTAIMTREFQFDQLMYVKISIQLFKMVLSVALVLMGFSYYGLAWAILATTLLETLLFRYYKPLIVSWKPAFKGVLPIAKFGIYVSLTNIMTRFETAAPDIIIGKAGTPSDVAVFSRGMGFLTFVTEVISNGILQVAFPHLSQVKRDGGDLSAAYCHATLLMGSVLWPILAVASLASYPAVIAMFGDQWTASVPIVTILAIWALFKSVHTMSASLFYSSGHESLLLIKQIVTFSVTVIALIGSVSFGLEYVAWAMVVVGVIEYLVCSVALYKAINLTPLNFASAMRPNMLLIAICYSCAWLLDLYIDFANSNPWLSLAALAAVMPWVWLASVFAIKHPICQELRPIFTAIGNKIRKPKY